MRSTCFAVAVGGALFGSRGHHDVALEVVVVVVVFVFAVVAAAAVPVAPPDCLAGGAELVTAVVWRRAAVRRPLNASDLDRFLLCALAEQDDTER
jgi:hypothetical protein